MLSKHDLEIADILMKELRPHKVSAEIVYRGVCREGGPAIEVQSAKRQKVESVDGFVAAMFPRQLGFDVKRDASDFIQISRGLTKPVVLSTKISRITFTDQEQYDSGLALGALLRTPELLKVEGELGARHTLHVDGLVQTPMPGLPKLPKELSGLTVDAILMQFVKTFGGIVVYGECTGRNRKLVYDLEFYRF